MAATNLNLAHLIFAAWERGDPLASLAWADPEIEFVIVGGAESGTWHGLAEAEGLTREFMRAWAELRVEAEEYRELDDERILVPARFSGRGMTSGVHVARADGCHLLHFRASRLARQVFYWNRTEAFADLGLPPDGHASGSPDNAFGPRYREATSQPNVETLRSFYERLNTTGEAPAGLFHRDLEIHMFEGALYSGPYRGFDGLRRWREDTFDVFEDWRLLLDDVISGDDPDVMVVTNRFVGRMRHTALAVDAPLTVVVRFRDGRIVRFEGYRERAEALTAAGL